MIYREARPEEADAVYEMVIDLALTEARYRADATGEEESSDWSKLQLTPLDMRNCIDPSSSLFCARSILAITDDGEIVGQALHNVDPDTLFVSWLGPQKAKSNRDADTLGGQPRVHLDELYVKKAHRGGKVGSMLFSIVKDYADMLEQKLTLLVDDANTGAGRFYRAKGMVLDEQLDSYKRLKL